MSTWTEVENGIKLKLPDAGINVISPQRLREAIQLVINQIIASTPDPVEFEWKATDDQNNSVTYEIGDPVIDDNRWFIAIAQNSNKKPVLPDGSINDAFWREENASTTRYIDNWEAKLFTYPVEIVLYNKKLYLLDRTVVGDGPFQSTDIAAEIAEDPSPWYDLTPGSTGGGGGIDPADIVNDFSTDPNDGSKVAGANSVYDISQKIKGKNSTGLVELDLIGNRIYGESTPLTGDIDFDLSYSVIGGRAVLYHNDSVAPSINLLLNIYEIGTYFEGVLNEIFIQKTGDSSVTISYTQPTVTEGVEDNTAPTISSAIIPNGNEDRLVVEFSEKVNIANVDGISISGDSNITVASIISGSGTNTVTFQLVSSASAGQSLTVDVTSSNTITDTSINSNVLAPVNYAITNNIGVAQQLNTPTNFVTSNVKATSMSLSWDAVTDAELYVLERDTDPGYASATQIYVGASPTYSDSGLLENSTYYYRVKAVDSDEIFSDSNFATLSESTPVSAGTTMLIRYPSLTTQEQNALKTFVNTLDDLGKWNLIDEIAFLSGLTNEADALVGGKSKTFTKIGSPTYSNGWVFGAGTNHLNSNFIPDTDGVNFTLNACSTGFRVLDNTTIGGSHLFGVIPSITSNSVAIRQNNSSVRLECYLNSSAGLDTSEGLFQDETTYTLERINASTIVVKRDTANTNLSETTQGLSNLPIHIGGRNNNGSPDQSYNGTGLVWFIGAAGIVDANYKAAENQLKTDLGL